jgi:hypothetical protein
MGEFVALELCEMFHSFNDIGFGAAGEPEVMENTKRVARLTSSQKLMCVARCEPQYLGRFLEDFRMEWSSIV